MNKTTERILKEYEAKADLYKKFTDAIRFLFENILKKGGYKYYIYARLKQIESLEEKIERKKLKGKIYKRLEDIKDIAGIRVIFYTEKDRRKFISKIQKEFKDSLKIKKTHKISGYRAVHANVVLGKERLKLSEYEAFKGLKCEIQLCLILEHAWAEIEHDVLYKENIKLSESDKVHYLHMKDRMQGIMQNYINKASVELERVVLQSKRIKRDSVGKLKSEILVH
ncbi:hypothetical protein A2917_01395 [Candidatus Nomurabacteria bacterium RIFCSPLOWO2_01_FULL_42_17]|uniref:RelA/SpoT domain-containing protein n=1 Tax=Candidatus Nomurabacteria bacterium RIFCSPLOWO2_01_FULL_42_17 TaxID=1801780 RepID=A0A1F6XLZ3_9BACT|nr:MAG: hypothetical protein A2917_01395 [Candidatus Nomurabacteria bacterium RIFCSPLOWO2_01_FULL_42_17]